MGTLRIFIFCLTVILSVSFSHAAEPGARPHAPEIDTVISKLKERFDGISSITAEFTQEAKSGSTPMGTLTGKVYLQRPGTRGLPSSMKWVYSNGDIVTSDGKTTWIYQPDLNQVIESKGAPVSIAADFLSGMEDVRKAFRVSLEGETGEVFILKLTPRQEQNSVKSITMEIGRSDYLVRKTVVRDNFGTVTEVSFSRMRLNETFKEGLFEFKPPRGARIVRP